MGEGMTRDLVGKKLFLTSFPNGELKLVDVIEKKRPELGGGYYIRYASGGTDTTTEKFLFELPDELLALCAKHFEQVAVEAIEGIQPHYFGIDLVKVEDVEEAVKTAFSNDKET